MTHLKASLIRLGLGLAALGAAAVALWPVAPSTFSPEKALAFMTALAAWGFSEFYTVGSDTKPATVVAEHDRILAKRLYGIADDDHISFLKGHDFGGMWRKAWLEPSYNLANELQKVTSEFNDSELQQQAVKLRDDVIGFASFMSLNSWHLDNKELVSMIPDRERNTEEWSERTKERVLKANESADAVAEDLEQLYRLIRQKGIALHDNIDGAGLTDLAEMRS